MTSVYTVGKKYISLFKLKDLNLLLICFSQPVSVCMSVFGFVYELLLTVFIRKFACCQLLDHDKRREEVMPEFW